jgi:antitoxin component YwqK of YwqJK toxin-antitoxin module
VAFSPETVAEFRDGLAQGRYRRFHPNGKLREEGEFNQGLPHGTWRQYDQNGVITVESSFSNGQFNGIQKRYYNGELGREITVNGETVIRFRSWHEGELMKDLEGVVGDPVQPRAIPPLQRRLNQIPQVPAFSGPKEELVTGKGRVWAIHPSTKARVIQGEFELKDGKPHGRYRGYHWSGELRAEEHSRDGLRHGTCRSWLEDGRLEAEVTYVDGVMQGPGRWLDTRSGQYRECRMRDDVVVGWMIDHHPNGAVNRVLHYVPLSPEAAADPKRRKSTNYRSGPRNEYDFGPRVGPWAVFDDTGRQTGGGFWIIEDGKSRSVDAEAFNEWIAANPQYGPAPRTLPVSPG